MDNKTIGILGLVIAVIAILVAVATPEIREFIGLESSEIIEKRPNTESEGNIDTKTKIERQPTKSSQAKKKEGTTEQEVNHKEKEESNSLPELIQRLIDDMVFVQGGTFEMGCTGEQQGCEGDEKPAHKVTLDDFKIGKYEVTQEQWQTVMGSNPSKYKSCGGQCPVEKVSWGDIQGFIQKLNRITGENFRLPTEAEWEYAARGGIQSKGYQYAGDNNIGSVAWYKSNSNKKPQVVGLRKSNELGLYDMSGNLWEWCEDGQRKYNSSSQKNPIGSSSSSDRVLRGGSFNVSAGLCRVSDRRSPESTHRGNCGFRLVSSVN